MKTLNIKETAQSHTRFAAYLLMLVTYQPRPSHQLQKGTSTTKPSRRVSLSDEEKQQRARERQERRARQIQFFEQQLKDLLTLPQAQKNKDGLKELRRVREAAAFRTLKLTDPLREIARTVVSTAPFATLLHKVLRKVGTIEREIDFLLALATLRKIFRFLKGSLPVKARQAVQQAVEEQLELFEEIEIVIQNGK